MINLAGNFEADKHIKEELFLANVDPVSGETRGEVPYTLIGKVGKWKLTRAWYYWVATVDKEDKGQGLSLDIALKLHNTKHPTREIMGNVVRSGGHAGCPSPDEYGAQPVYNDELDEKLIALGFEKEYSKPLDEEFVSINVGEMSELCNKGKLDVERFVDCYHIDDQIGLNTFVEFVKNMEKSEQLK